MTNASDTGDLGLRRWSATAQALVSQTARAALRSTPVPRIDLPNHAHDQHVHHHQRSQSTTVSSRKKALATTYLQQRACATRWRRRRSRSYQPHIKNELALGSLPGWGSSLLPRPCHDRALTNEGIAVGAVGCSNLPTYSRSSYRSCSRTRRHFAVGFSAEPSRSPCPVRRGGLACGRWTTTKKTQKLLPKYVAGRNFGGRTIGEIAWLEITVSPSRACPVCVLPSNGGLAHSPNLHGLDQTFGPFALSFQNMPWWLNLGWR